MPFLFASRRAQRCLLAFTCWGIAVPSIADDVLMSRVHQFLFDATQALGEEVAINVRPPSPHLPACIDPTPFFPNANQPPLGRVSVGVRCGADQRQIRYLQAHVEVVGRYVVASRDIERGTLITRDMLIEQQGNLSALSSQTLVHAEDVIGKVAQRSLRSGAPFLDYAVQSPALVARGQRVTVLAEGPAFRVSREGEALDSGALGEQVRVRFGQREIVTARVVESATLVVDF